MIRDEIFELVKERGPVLPVQISKLMKMDSLLASAYLSELVSSKKIRISSTKVGGSPVYYADGQEPKLQDYRQNLDENEQKAYDMLKKEKVVNDADLGPLMKYTFRQIKDFAVPLKVNKKDIFWKWYLITNDEAVELIKLKVKEKPTIVIKEEKKDDKKEARQEKVIEKKQETKQKVEEKKEEKVKPEIKKEEPKVEEKPKIEIQKPKVEKKKEKVEKKEDEKAVQETLTDPIFKQLEEFKRKREQEFAKKQEELMNQLDAERKLFDEELKRQAEEVKKRLEDEKKQQEDQQKQQVMQDSFFIKIRTFFDENKIKIENYELVKKEKELDFVITVPSAVGEVKYYCKAKDKKRVNEGDLSTAYFKGQGMSLPTLFLATGDIVKKAADMIGKEFKQMLVKKI